ASRAWNHLLPAVKAYLLAVAILLFAYISFYARSTIWSGDFARGDRYVSTAAQLATFISVPLRLRHRPVWENFCGAPACF
ncbi:MAG: hypothetical protein JO266_19355, partial [Acidobacteria bacterium]|nr:hypothetical protein [Acidobacteriota bacterium]